MLRYRVADKPADAARTNRSGTTLRRSHPGGCGTDGEPREVEAAAADPTTPDVPVLYTTALRPPPGANTLRLILPNGVTCTVPLFKWDGKSRLPFPATAKEAVLRNPSGTSPATAKEAVLRNPSGTTAKLEADQ